MSELDFNTAGLEPWGGLRRPSAGSRPDVRILGVPMDRGSLYRPGAAKAPAALRKLSAIFAPVSEHAELFDTVTIQDDGDTPGCALHNGVLYFGGHFNYAGAGCQHTTAPPCLVYHHVAAADVATNTLLSWNPGANSNHGIYTVRQDATHVGFGGYQTNFGGKLQEGYATYSTTLP